MKKQVIFKLIDYYIDTSKILDDFEEATGASFHKLEMKLNNISDLILDIFEVRTDTTIELGIEHPDVFCRDYYSNMLFECIEGNITKEGFIKMMSKARNEDPEGFLSTNLITELA